MALKNIGSLLAGDESWGGYLLEDGVYWLQLKSISGDVTSQVVRGFTIPISAIFDSAFHLATIKRSIG